MHYRALSGVVIGFLVLISLSSWGGAFDYQSLPSEVKEGLLEGECVILPARPDEGEEKDGRFVTAAMLIEGSRDVIWEVINDKDGAEDFIEGILESAIIEEDGNVMVVQQRTKVGGPKESYTYTIRHVLTPKVQNEFSYVEGELRNVLGSWWIFDGPDTERFLVVYSLHIDPGVFAPQFVVRSGMKKSMPNTIQAMKQEVERRMASSGGN